MLSMLRWIMMMVLILPLWGGERYEELFSQLRQAGMTEAEIRHIFDSPKASRIDETTLRMIASVSKIPHLRERERAANERLLKEPRYLQRHLERYRSVYDEAERRYGVNREVIAALLQKETALGAYTRFKHDAFVVFNTILGQLTMPENPTERERLRTRRLWREAAKNLKALILYYRARGVDVSVADLPSSYAGAMGIPQFTPWLLNEAVSFSGGEADLMKMEDAIMSVSHLLRHRLGWPKTGLIEWKRLEDLEELNEAWIAFDTGRANIAFDVNLEGLEVPSFSRVHGERADVRYLAPYLRTLMGYNYSSDYAMGILRIARAVRSGD